MASAVILLEFGNITISVNDSTYSMVLNLCQPLIDMNLMIVLGHHI